MPYVAAGWVVTTPTLRPAGLDELIPDPFLTISPCLADVLVAPEFSGWFQRLEDARAAADVAPAGSTVFGVAIDEDLAQQFAAEVDEHWHFDLLRRAVQVDPEFLGFEIVGAEYALQFHSWHCHRFATEAYGAMGIGINDVGLLATAEDAERVREWMLDQPATTAPAPVPWTVVALWRPGPADE